MALTVGIVGTGGIAKTRYVPFLAKVDDVSLLYWNRTRQKAEDCAAQFGGKVLGSIEDLVAARPDAILVLTNEMARYEVAMKLLAGRPRRLFFEKPLVAMEGQARVREKDFHLARELLQRARDGGTETAMVFNYRFFDVVQTARRIIQERSWGKFLHAAAFVHYACWSHAIDLLQWFAGPVARVSALAGPVEYDWSGKACDMAGSFVLENQATGTILGTQGMSFTGPLFDIVLSLEGGRLRLRCLDCEMEVIDYNTRHVERSALTPHISRWDTYGASFGRSVGAYLQSIRDGGEPPVPGLAGLRELQFEAALKRSAAEGRPVDVQKEFPLL